MTEECFEAFKAFTDPSLDFSEWRRLDFGTYVIPWKAALELYPAAGSKEIRRRRYWRRMARVGLFPKRTWVGLGSNDGTTWTPV